MISSSSLPRTLGKGHEGHLPVPLAGVTHLTCTQLQQTSPAQIAGELGSRCAFNPNTQEAETGKISEVKASLV